MKSKYALPIVHFLVPMAVAAVLGPLLVAVALSLVGLASDLLGPAPAPSLADYGELLFFQVIMAYFIAGPIALLAGFLVSIWMLRRSPSALVINVAAIIATLLFMGVAATGLLGPVEEANGRSNVGFMLVAAVFSANGCWFLLRRFAEAKKLR